MKVLGALESAQIEWFTSGTKPAPSSYPYRVIYTTDTKQILVSDGTTWLPSNITFYTSGTLPVAGPTNAYQVAFITDTFQVRVSNGTVWTTIGARLDTYTSGTIPAASANSNQLIWVSDIQQVQISNGTSWVQVGSASGLKNYFAQNNANPNFETNSVTPWSACTLTFSSGVPSGAPTLTATQMALSVSASSPLSGSYSMLLSKSAANAQYQGVISGAMTIDREDTAKVLYGSFSYEVVSGTVDFSGASTQTYEIWIYNTVSGAWTQPAGYRGMNQSSGQGKVTFSFQTDGSVSNNSYKIAVITQQTGTGAIVVKFDSFQIGPSAIVLGAVVTDWRDFPSVAAGTLITATVTNPSFGTIGVNKAEWRRVGDSMEIMWDFRQSTAGGAGSGGYLFNLPPGYVIDSTKTTIGSANSDSKSLGVFHAFDGASLIGTGWVYAYSSTQLAATFQWQNGSVSYSTTGWSNGGTVTFASTSGQFSLLAKLPIAGWSSNVQVSSDTDTRVVAFQAIKNGGTATSLSNITSWSTLVEDTHGAFNNTTGEYVVPVSGDYQVNVTHGGSNAGNNSSIFLNSGAVIYGAAGIRTSVSHKLKCVAGDKISTQATSTFTPNADNNSTVMSIFRLSGPSVIAATESVNAKYYSCTSSISSTLGTMTYATKVFDSHNAYSGGIYTLPVSGKFQINAGIFVSATFSASNAVNISIFNGATEITRTYLVMQGWTGSSTFNQYVAISDIISGNAGDQITIKAACGGTSPTVATSSQISNYFSIARVGN